MGVNMRRYLGRWLNDSDLRRLDGRFEGVIAKVHEEEFNNRFKGAKELQPVITFEDGWRLIPNISMRRALIEFWGPDSDDHIGRRVIVFRHRAECVDRKTGEMKERWEKRLMRPDPDPNVRMPRRRRPSVEASTDAEPVAARDIGLPASEIPWGQGGGASVPQYACNGADDGMDREADHEEDR